MKIASRIKWCAQRVALAVPLGLVGLAHAQQEPLPAPDVALVGLGEIQSMVEQPHYGLVLAGTFTQIQGAARNGLARMAHSSVDTSWDPGAVWLDAVPTVPRRVKMAPDGGIFVSGDLVEIGGQAVDCIVKLKPNGTLDTGWSAPTTNCDFDPVFDHSGWMYFIETDGSVRRARVDIGGTPDPQWRHQPWNGSYAARKLLLEFGDSLYVASREKQSPWPGNRISKVSTSSVYQHEVWSRTDDVDSDIVALQQSEYGTLYMGYANGLIRTIELRTASAGSDWQTSGGLRAMKLGNDGAIYLAASDGVKKFSAPFTAAQETYEVTGGGRVNQVLMQGGGTFLSVAGKFLGLGGIASQSLIHFNSMGGGNPSEGGGFEVTAPGSVEGVVMQPNGGAIVRGDFIKAAKLPRQYMFRLTPEGEVDPDWTAAPDGPVRQVEVANDNAVYIGGEFGTVNNFPSAFLAKLNGATGLPDFSWWPQLNLQAAPMDLAMDAQNRLYVAPGQPMASPNVQRVLADGQVDPNWSVYTSGTSVSGIDAIGDKLYVRHRDYYPGSPIRLDRYYLTAGAAWDYDWSISVLDDTGARDFRINAVTADAVGNILVGGRFDRLLASDGMGGTNLVRLGGAATATLDTSWQPSVNGAVDAIAVDAAGEIYVAGRFDTVNTQPRKGLVKLSPLDASLRTEWVASHGARALCVADAQRLFVVGADWRNSFVALPLQPGGVTAIEQP